MLAVLLASAVSAEPPAADPPKSQVPAGRGPSDADREAGKLLAPAERFAAAGQIDRFVASSATWGLPADSERLWQPLRDLVPVLGKKAKHNASYANLWFNTSDDKLPVGISPAPRGVVAVRSDRIHSMPEKVARSESGNAHEAVIAAVIVAPKRAHLYAGVSRGPVRIDGSLDESVLLANGDVSIGLKGPHHGACQSSIVVTDGDVEVGGKTTNSLVVARGNIVVRGHAEFCRFVAGGRVTVENPLDFRNQIDGSPDPRVPVVEEKQRNPFGWVTWFELIDVGVVAEMCDGGVLVTAVNPGNPFAAAGVQKGDVVTHVGKDAVATPDDLRRRLRDAHATAGQATVTVRRAGQTTDLRVRMPD